LAAPATAKKKPPPPPEHIKVVFEDVIITSQGGGIEHICVFTTPSGHFKQVPLAACQAPGHTSAE
jgi:hypothetical protein